MSGGEESSSLPVGRSGFNPNEPFKEVPKENRTAPIWDNFVQLKQQKKIMVDAISVTKFMPAQMSH